jgi:hypothetical protein
LGREERREGRGVIVSEEGTARGVKRVEGRDWREKKEAV